VGDLGRMVGLLRSEDVEPVHGITQSDRLIEPFRDAGLAVDLEVTGTPRELPRGVDSAAFRIAQEALTNAMKHGGGRASVRIGYEPEALRMRVSNPVATTSTPGTGHGVAGMRERARLFGGQLEAGRNGDGTFVVDVSLPVPAA
jgi:signal transduction histidine kinase